MMNVHDYGLHTHKIKQMFSEKYPDLDINTINDDFLLNDIIFNIINNDSNTNSNIDCNDSNINSNDLVIKQNILLANEYIPEMLFPTNLIRFDGRINNIDVNILLDTGASGCVIYKSIVDKCNLNNIIDKNSYVMVEGVSSIEQTIGTIWYLEIELKIPDKNYVTIPIIVNVIDDSKIIKESTNNINYSKDKIQLILGMTFLKSYRANIDFYSMILTLNNSIKIKFK